MFSFMMAQKHWSKYINTNIIIHIIIEDIFSNNVQVFNRSFKYFLAIVHILHFLVFTFTFLVETVNIVNIAFCRGLRIALRDTPNGISVRRVQERHDRKDEVDGLKPRLRTTSNREALDLKDILSTSNVYTYVYLFNCIL